MLAEIQTRHDAALNEWRTHYEGKLNQEALSRLNAMLPFFAECQEDKRLCASAYLPEAFRRTVVQEIISAMEALKIENPDVIHRAQVVDNQLRELLTPTDFLWASILQPVYPEDTFWCSTADPPIPSHDLSTRRLVGRIDSAGGVFDRIDSPGTAKPVVRRRLDDLGGA